MKRVLPGNDRRSACKNCHLRRGQAQRCLTAHKLVNEHVHSWVFIMGLHVRPLTAPAALSRRCWIASHDMASHGLVDGQRLICLGCGLLRTNFWGQHAFLQCKYCCIQCVAACAFPEEITAFGTIRVQIETVKIHIRCLCILTPNSNSSYVE